MPAEYDKLGIRFLYPENWRLDEEEAVHGDSTVTVYSPDGGAFWTIVVHPAGADPRELTATGVRTMKEIYDSLEAEPVQETIAEQEMSGFDMHFYCLDLTNTAVLRSFSTPLATYVILYQAEDREWPQFEPVFQAMTHSLVSAL